MYEDNFNTIGTHHDDADGGMHGLEPPKRRRARRSRKQSLIGYTLSNSPYGQAGMNMGVGYTAAQSYGGGNTIEKGMMMQPMDPSLSAYGQLGMRKPRRPRARTRIDHSNLANGFSSNPQPAQLYEQYKNLVQNNSSSYMPYQQQQQPKAQLPPPQQVQPGPQSITSQIQNLLLKLTPESLQFVRLGILVSPLLKHPIYSEAQILDQLNSLPQSQLVTIAKQLNIGGAPKGDMNSMQETIQKTLQ